MKLLRACLTLSAMLAAPGAALAQVDYSAGKSAPQLFSSDCSACHQSPGGLAKGRDASALASFLREHYTTGGASAGLLANYLAGLPAGRQPAVRTPQAPGATATAPAGATPRPPAAVEAERTKPGDARKPKPTDAEREAKPVGTQAEREPAKPASVDPLSTKLRSYATTGEPATPVAAAAPAEAEPGAVPLPVESSPPEPAQPSEPSQSARPPG
ncbi:MAG: hypothetical protein JOZ94_03665 [Xanthobacteraceae bacterium]|nr:hypothetical protein [Xanthobacteraceae bacterium]MBV9631228.1 hypothetical protein [Xanthobacteraceae bacterium]